MGNVALKFFFLSCFVDARLYVKWFPRWHHVWQKCHVFKCACHDFVKVTINSAFWIIWTHIYRVYPKFLELLWFSNVYLIDKFLMFYYFGNSPASPACMASKAANASILKIDAQSKVVRCRIFLRGMLHLWLAKLI